MKYKTTNKDFEKFKKHCKKWIEFWNLYEWEIYFTHTANANARASCWWDISGMIATIGLGKEWGDKPEPYELSRVAFHEVCEVMLSLLTQLAQDEYSERKASRRSHTIIRRLENIVFEKFKDKSDL